MGSALRVARAAAPLVGAANEAEVERDRTREAKGDVPGIDEADPESARDHVDEDDERRFKALCACVYEITMSMCVFLRLSLKFILLQVL